MPVTVSDTADARAEKAIAGYIRGQRDSNSDDATYTGTLTLDSNRVGDLSGIAVHEGRQTQNLVAPAIVVAAERCEKLYDDADYYSVDVQITLTTSINEGANTTTRQHAEVLHMARSKAIADLINDEATLKLGLNAPVVGTDSRAVDEFTLHYWLGYDESFDATENMLVHTWNLPMVCSPWDAVKTP